MAKAIYTGVSSVARKVKGNYIGVSGVARKVKAGWIGVGGVARQFWSGGEYVLYDRGTNHIGFTAYSNTDTTLETSRITVRCSDYYRQILLPSRIDLTKYSKLGMILSAPGMTATTTHRYPKAVIGAYRDGDEGEEFILNVKSEVNTKTWATDYSTEDTYMYDISSMDNNEMLTLAIRAYNTSDTYSTSDSFMFIHKIWLEE